MQKSIADQGYPTKTGLPIDVATISRVAHAHGLPRRHNRARKTKYVTANGKTPDHLIPIKRIEMDRPPLGEIILRILESNLKAADKFYLITLLGPKV